MSSADLVTDFTDGLVEHSVTWETTTAAELPETLRAEMRGSTVGTPLPDAAGADPYPPDVTTSPSAEEIKAADTGITPGLLGVANYGSVVITPTEHWEGSVSLYPPKHIAVLARSDIVPDVPTAFARLSERFETGANDAIFVTGVSSTGDMGASVNGVHGPTEMHVVVIEE